MLTTACARDGVDARLAQLREWGSESDETGDLDIVWDGCTDAPSRPSSSSGAGRVPRSNEGGLRARLGASAIGGTLPSSQQEVQQQRASGDSGHAPRLGAPGRQAAPMVLNLEDPACSSEEVLELELGRLGLVQLRALHDGLAAVAGLTV
jgi:hypothetical protein